MSESWTMCRETAATFLWGLVGEAAANRERIIFVRESMDRKVIDSEGLDHHFFVALTNTSLSIAQTDAPYKSSTR
jgi:hypothetical protein